MPWSLTDSSSSTLRTGLDVPSTATQRVPCRGEQEWDKDSACCRRLRPRYAPRRLMATTVRTNRRLARQEDNRAGWAHRFDDRERGRAGFRQTPAPRTATPAQQGRRPWQLPSFPVPPKARDSSCIADPFLRPIAISRGRIDERRAGQAHPNFRGRFRVGPVPTSATSCCPRFRTNERCSPARRCNIHCRYIESRDEVVAVPIELVSKRE